jgi:uncharacterized phage protein (predicted DNA packaging)
MIVELDAAKRHLNFTENTDDALIGSKLQAAQNHIENLLGFAIEERYGGEDQRPVPDDLKEAVCLLMAHWYENREASAASGTLAPIPYGVAEILREYRCWTFG